MNLFQTPTPTTNHASSRPESRTSGNPPVQSISIMPNNLALTLDPVADDVPTPSQTHTTTSSLSTPSVIPDDWFDIDPDCVMARMKNLNSSAFGGNDKCFYKSYTTWNKLTLDQRNKATAWFRKLDSSTRSE